MIIQHFVPTNADDDSPKAYYKNVMVWVCGAFALIGMLSALSMVPIKIGQRRKINRKKLPIE